MAFHPLTPADPEPEPFRFKPWHGLVLIGVMTIGAPGMALLLRDDGPRVPQVATGGTLAPFGDASLAAGAEAVVDLSDPPSLAVYTIPVGVAVTLDGEPVGVTPFRSTDLERRAYGVSLRAEGYAAVDTVVDLASNPRSLLAVDLVPDVSAGTESAPRPALPVATPQYPGQAPGVAPTPPAAAPTVVDDRPGELTVSVIPWGSIYIDGRLMARESDVTQTFTLPPGRHTIVAEHPSLGRTQRTVDLRPGGSRTVTFELSP